MEQYFSLLTEDLLKADFEKISELVKDIIEAGKNNKNIYVFGNGGSGANASHFVQDLLKCPVKDFDSVNGRYRAICLNDNTPVIMAYANDLSYEEVFKQQLMNFCESGDLIIGVSGSGNSMNVVKALDFGKEVKAKTWAIVGFDGGKLLKTAEQNIHFQTSNMQRYEDLSMITFHAIISSLKP